MYPAASQMFRAAAEDTVIPTYEPHINDGMLAVKKGEFVNVDLVGMRTC